MAKILELVQQKEVSISDMLHAIADAVENGEVEVTKGTVVLVGGVLDTVKVYGLGESKTVAESNLDLDLGKIRLMRIPMQLTLSQIDLG